MLRHNSCLPGQPVPIYLSTHISNSFLGRFTRKTTIGCRDPNQGVFLTSLNKLAILMQNHLIKSSRDSPMLLPIHQDTRYLSRRITTCHEIAWTSNLKLSTPEGCQLSYQRWILLLSPTFIWKNLLQVPEFQNLAATPGTILGYFNLPEVLPF